jgi:maleate isomerase
MPGPHDVSTPNVNMPPMPALSGSGVILNGQAVEHFTIDSSRGYPDALSFRRKFGLLVPATNTSMEHDLWTVLRANAGAGLEGIGLHTSAVVTPSPQLATETDLLEYKGQFLSGLKAAIDVSLLAQPQYLIMGMSLEHIISGLDGIRGVMSDVERYCELAWATWQDAIKRALDCYRARRIGLLTPFDKTGNDSATRMFVDLGFEVAASVGFSCANALHIAHVPDWAKERAIMELLATDANQLDAIVQCGTNMSMIAVAQRLEPIVGIPILGINATLLWHALRQNGFATPMTGAGRLCREF